MPSVCLGNTCVVVLVQLVQHTVPYLDTTTCARPRSSFVLPVASWLCYGHIDTTQHIVFHTAFRL